MLLMLEYHAAPGKSGKPLAHRSVQARGLKEPSCKRENKPVEALRDLQLQLLAPALI